MQPVQLRSLNKQRVASPPTDCGNQEFRMEILQLQDSRIATKAGDVR